MLQVERSTEELDPVAITRSRPRRLNVKSLILEQSLKLTDTHASRYLQFETIDEVMNRLEGEDLLALLVLQ